MTRFTSDFIFRIIGILAKFGVLFLLERTLSTEEFSKYILIISIIALTSNALRFGSDNLLFRISTSGSLFQLSQGLNDVINLYKKSLVIKVILVLLAIPYFSVSELFVIFIGIEGMSFLHYYCLVIRGRGNIKESIIIFDVIPPVALIIMLYIVPPTYGIDAALTQHLIYILLVAICFIYHIRFIKCFMKRHASYYAKPFMKYFRKITPFGLSNFTNSFTSWGDVILVTLLFDPAISAGYFMITRIVAACERISVIPLYPAYNILGQEFQLRQQVALSTYLGVMPAIGFWALIIMFSSLGILAVLDILPIVMFEVIDVFPVMVQFLLALSLVIITAGGVVDTIAIQTGFEKTVLKNALAIMALRVLTIGIFYFFVGIDFLLYIVLGVLFILIGKAFLIKKIFYGTYNA